ncbi:autotransporter domain-containing protein [Agrobacterium sp. ICMP 6402]|uniref:autotransporter outer membrane beta-barrel domain-containing protein n=1 Tax=Agrobacterium sp. ICMP 6402 TaxID=2292443 RepID=UPI0012969348|nr:autotransporter domain-containing protein [Agrobacterium sp. ICMP 6402]MQB12791.1 autotransporter domain-containing protein [Agrobacterium sp. ICMP 6402]
MSGWFCGVSEGKDPQKTRLRVASLSRHFLRGSTGLFAVMFSAALSPSALADTIVWVGSSTDDWFLASSWYGYTRVPGANDTASFNSEGPTIAAGTHANVSGLAIGLDTDASLSVNGGLSTTYSEIGANAGIAGKLNFSGGNWSNGGNIFVARNGVGDLDVSGSSITSLGHIYIGEDGLGYGTVKLDNSSSLENSDTVFVGYGGFGSLEVLGASELKTGRLVVAGGVGSMGTVTVEGAGSTLTSSGDMVIGGDGSGSFVIAGGGVVISQGNMVIGDLASSGGSALKIDGAGSMLETQGTLIVGNEGAVTMSVGTAATVTSGAVTIGRNSAGVVNVTGGGTNWTTGDLRIGGDALAAVGTPGYGMLNVDTGGRVESVSARLGNVAGATGSTIVDGSGSVWTVGSGSLGVGVDGAGSLVVTGSGVVETADTVLGVNADGVGSLRVSGSGSALRNSANLYVGNAGKGSLQIDAGGAVTSGAGYVATLGGSRSSVTIAGGGSSWTVARALVVGYQNGAVGEVSVDTGAGIQAGQVTLGELAGSSGILMIEGTGSNVTAEVDNNLADSGSMNIGRSGTGQVTVLNGASLNANQLSLGTEAGSDGALRIVGVGSHAEIGNTLVIGRSGGGTVEVTGGGSVAATTIVIASAAGSTGVLNIGAAAGQTAHSAGEVEAEAIAFGAGNGSIVLNHSENDYELSADISGAGRIDAENGVTTLGGNNSYSGGTTISAGTLKGTATSFGSGEIANNAALVVDGAGRLSNVISGSGSFEKTGSGNLILTGNSTHSGTTEVSSGKLSVNGSLASVISVANGAALGGSGTIGGVTVQSGGTLAPGNSIGTLTSTGNATFASGSAYAVEIDSYGNSDRLAVTGTVTIANNVNLIVTPVTDSLTFAFGAKYVLLTATGGVSGAFADVVGNLDYLKTAVTKSGDNNTVYLLLKRESFGPGSFAASTSTGNARSAANAVEALGEGSALYDAAYYLQQAETQTAFSQLAGELHPSLAMALINRSQLTRDVILSRLRSAFKGIDARSILPAVGGMGAPDPMNIDEGSLTLWSNGFGSRGHIDGDGSGSSVNMKGGGVFFGLDGDWGDGWRAGVAAGYGRDVISQKSLSAADVDSYYLAAYGGGIIGPASLRFGAVHAFQDVVTRRTVSFSTLHENLTAGYDASTTQVFAEAAWRFDFDLTQFEPYANISYVNTKTDAFGEKGGIATVSSGSANHDQLYSTLGARFSRDIAFESLAGQAMFDIGWRHAYGDPVVGSTLFYTGGSGFSVASAAMAQDVALLNLGLSYDINPSATLTFRYGAVFGAGVLDQSASAELGVRF